MQTTKGRASPKESPTKVSLRTARQLKIIPIEPSTLSPSSIATARTPRDKSPKVAERRTPRSPICEKRPKKLAEFESQISQLQNDLKSVKDQLSASESLKKEAQADAEDVKKQLAHVSLQLEESQKQLSELGTSKNTSVIDQEDISQSASETTNYDRQSLNSDLDEITRLKQLESSLDNPHANLQSLNKKLEIMKIELQQMKESEAQSKNLVNQTLLQLEAAKETINTLRSDVGNSTEAYNSVVSELQQSRAQVSFLECLVNNLKKVSLTDPTDNQPSSEEESKYQGTLDANELRSALEASEKRFNEEQSNSKKQIESAAEQFEMFKAESCLQQAELEKELKKANAKVDELKASLMDKETELQAVSEANNMLNAKLEKSESCNRDQEIEAELAKLREHIAVMEANLMDKERELQNVFQEKVACAAEVEAARAAEVEAARAAEVEAMTKLGYMMEEADKSNRKALRVTEQLEVAQAASADMEAELRRLKVQSDQWRKAAEAAASMLSPGSNDKFVERSGSMPLGKYSPVGGRIGSPYLDDYDDDTVKKKNGNVLKKFGVLWKKPHK